MPASNQQPQTHIPADTFDPLIKCQSRLRFRLRALVGVRTSPCFPTRGDCPRSSARTAAVA